MPRTQTTVRTPAPASRAAPLERGKNANLRVLSTAECRGASHEAFANVKSSEPVYPVFNTVELLHTLR